MLKSEIELLNNIKKDKIQKLTSLIDNKEDELLLNIMESNSFKQIDRYRMKTKIALYCEKENNYSPFELEAELKNLSPKELCIKIIEKSNEVNKNAEPILILLEAIRTKFKDIIEEIKNFEELYIIDLYYNKLKNIKVEKLNKEYIKEFFKSFQKELEGNKW